MRGFHILAAGVLASAAPAAAVPGPLGKPGADHEPVAETIALSRAFLIGAWTDDGDCDHAVEFLGDGRYFSGNARGIWQLDGHELTLTSDAILVVQLVPLDRDTIGVIGEDGSLGQSTRCAHGAMTLPGADETV